MGKKYDDYAEASRTEALAKMRLTDAEGGSTRFEILEAKYGAEDARKNADEAWQTFIADPEG